MALLRSGYFWPLDVRRALDSDYGREYAERCAARARREPTSARNEQAVRALRAIEQRRKVAAVIAPEFTAAKSARPFLLRPRPP